MSMEKLRHELLTDLAEKASQLLRDFGIEADTSDQIGYALADHLAEHWGGQLISIPKNYAFKLIKRDLEIWERFNGRNHAALAVEYGISVRGIYKVIQRVKRQQTALSQPGLFE